MIGTAFGVGVGPGDPELLTLKAVRLIKECDAIAVPGKSPRDTVAYRIAAAAVPDVLEFANIRVDVKKFEATKGGVPLDLTTREYLILKYFWAHRGEVVLREDILKEIWGYTDENMPSTRTVDNHIANLRRKIEDDLADPKIIISVRGAGYKFDA